MTCLRLILGEMQAAQLLHPHIGVPQLRHVVTQGHDAVETTTKGCVTPERSLAPTSQLEGALPGEPHPTPTSFPATEPGGDAPCCEPRQS